MRPRWRDRQREAGAVGLQVVLLAAVAATVVLVVAASAGSVLAAAGRAQDAADAAALAAARARVEAGAPRAAAAAAASAHGATLVACACNGPQVRVAVSVPVVAPAARALGITSQHASAAARPLQARLDPAPVARAVVQRHRTGTYARRTIWPSVGTRGRCDRWYPQRDDPTRWRPDAPAGPGHSAGPVVRPRATGPAVDADRLPAGGRPPP